MSDAARRCNATVDGKMRCQFGGTQDELVEHARFTGHQLCVVCARSLLDDELQTCLECVKRCRADLSEIVDYYAHLPDVIEASVTPAGGDALVFYVDGAVESSVQQMHPGEYDHDAEWPNDPIPVVALLESWEREWRLQFGHGPAEGLATVAGCAGYLGAWLPYAAKHHPGFDDYAQEVHALRVKLQRAVGLANQPLSAPAECFDCNGKLVRYYRPLRIDPAQRRRDAANAVEDARIKRVAEQMLHETQRKENPNLEPMPGLTVEEKRWIAAQHLSGSSIEGLTDEWKCSNCERIYAQEDYFRALHSARSEDGWIDVRLASEVAKRPVRTIRDWINRGEVAAACRVLDHAVLVWWRDVHDRTFEKLRRVRVSA